LYLMFMGSYQDGGDWSDEGIVGIFRFLNRLWRLVHLVQEEGDGGAKPPGEDLNRIMHHTIKQVGQDLDRFHFNTAISRLMEFVNALYLYIAETPEEKRHQKFLQDATQTLALLIAPFAPHLGEELWEILGNKESIFLQEWPSYDPKVLEEREVTIVVQVNGKVRARIQVPADIAEEDLKKLVLAEERVKAYVSEGVKRVVVVPGRLVNVVV